MSDEEKEQAVPRPAAVVYGASSSHIDPRFVEAARELGGALARAGIAVINGGGRTGLMGATTEGALAAGGHVIGIIPEFMLRRGWQHPGLSEIMATDGMHPRKQAMARLSQAAIALPGGVGTFEELLEIITWRKLGLYEGPVVIVNTLGYYDPLIEMLHRTESWGFTKQGPDERLYSVASTPEEAVALAFPDLKK